MNDDTGYLGTGDVAVGRSHQSAGRGADRALACDAGDAVRLPAVFTPIAVSTDQGETWTPLPRALMSVEAAYELRAMGHADVHVTPNGPGRSVLQVRAARS